MATVKNNSDGSKPKPKPKSASEMLDRQPPSNLPAERATLGSILLLPLAIDDVMLILKPEDFYDQAHATLYATLADMRDKNHRIDMTLLQNRLIKDKTYDQIGGGPYLAEILGSVETAAHAAFYAQIVRDTAIKREMIQAGYDIVRDGYESSEDAEPMLAKFEERALSISRGRHAANTVQDLGKVLQASLLAIERRESERGLALGLDTGFNDLDQMLGGMRPGNLVIVAARPSLGKTAFAVNLAMFAAQQQAGDVAFFSLEMNAVELGDRILCSESRVNLKHARRPELLRADERDRLLQTTATISALPLLVDDEPGRTISELSSVCRRLRHKKPLAMVLLDYMQLVEPEPERRRENRQEQMSEISRKLKRLAKELECPVVALAQLNREAAKDKERPKLHHLRESGAIEQDADTVLLLHREDYYLTNEDPRYHEVHGLAEVIVAKQRNGPTGVVKLAWHEEYTSFGNLSMQQEF